MEPNTVVVVGATNDVGMAVVTSMAQPGGLVAMVDEDAAALRSLAELVRAKGADPLVVATPLHDLAALKDLASHWPGPSQPCDALVNCQLDVPETRIEDADLTVWEQSLTANLTGVVAATQALLPMLRRSVAPSIVNVGSIDGLQANPRLGSYSVAKGGLLTLTRLMAIEFGPSGIRANYVARCMTQPAEGTDRSDTSSERSVRMRAVEELTPLGRIGRADETAAVIRFLCSSDASFVNGAVLTVDGGRTSATPGTVPGVPSGR